MKNELHISQEDRQLSARIPANVKAIDEVCARVQVFLHAQGADSIEFAVLLGVREALTNAIMHGAKNNAELDVHLALEVEDAGVLVTVEDPGKGFARDGLAFPMPDATAQSGRGLAIIRVYFDIVNLNELGNKIEMKKLF